MFLLLLLLLLLLLKRTIPLKRTLPENVINIPAGRCHGGGLMTTPIQEKKRKPELFVFNMLDWICMVWFVFYLEIYYFNIFLFLKNINLKQEQKYIFKT
jgi:hypothetical protein